MTRSWWASRPLRTKGFIAALLPAAPIIVLWILIGIALVRPGGSGPGPAARAREVQASLLRLRTTAAEARLAAYLGHAAPSSSWSEEINQASVHISDPAGRALLESLRAALTAHEDALAVIARGPSAQNERDRVIEADAFAQVTRAREALEAQRAEWVAAEQGEARQTNTWFTIIFLAGSVVAVIGGLWLSVRVMRDITRRVEHVVAGADALSKGEAMSLPALGADEIGTLAVRLTTILQLLRAREAELALKNADLATVNRELEAFSYSISHDLRAPLRAISGFSQVIAEDAGDRLDASALNALGRVRAASERMSVLIDELLNLSRVARLPVRLGRLDLTAIAHDVVSHLRERDPARGVRVSIQEGMTLDADPTLMKIVLENLIGNAWKYTARATDPEIVVQATETGTSTVVTVRDNGAGFDMAHARHLFGVFQRMHTQKEFDGTGVGLAIVQRLVHRHGGQISADARVGHGATFTFEIPRGLTTNDPRTDSAH